MEKILEFFSTVKILVIWGPAVPVKGVVELGLEYVVLLKRDPLPATSVRVSKILEKLILFIFRVSLSVKVPVWSQTAAKFAVECVTLATRILFVQLEVRSDMIMALGFVGPEAVEPVV
jgi:hypothetical protein